MLEVKPEYPGGPPKQGEVFSSITEFVDRITPLMQAGGQRVKHITPEEINRNAYYLYCTRAARYIGKDQLCTCVAGASFLQEIQGAVQCLGLLLQHSQACIQLQREESEELQQAEEIDIKPVIEEKKPNISALASAIDAKRAQTSSQASERPPYTLPSPAQTPELPDTPNGAANLKPASAAAVPSAANQAPATQPISLWHQPPRVRIPQVRTSLTAAAVASPTNPSTGPVDPRRLSPKRAASGDALSRSNSPDTRSFPSSASITQPPTGPIGLGPPSAAPSLPTAIQRPPSGPSAPRQDAQFATKKPSPAAIALGRPPIGQKGPQRSFTSPATIGPIPVQDDVSAFYPSAPRVSSMNSSALLQSVNKVSSSTAAKSPVASGALSTASPRPLSAATAPAASAAAVRPATAVSVKSVASSTTQETGPRPASADGVAKASTASWSEDINRKTRPLPRNLSPTQPKLPFLNPPRPVAASGIAPKTLPSPQSIDKLPNFQKVKPSQAEAAQQKAEGSRSTESSVSPTTAVSPLPPTPSTSGAQGFRPISVKAQYMVKHPPETVQDASKGPEKSSLFSRVYPDPDTLLKKINQYASETNMEFKIIAQKGNAVTYTYYRCKNYLKPDMDFGGTECPCRINAKQEEGGKSVKITRLDLDHNEACIKLSNGESSRLQTETSTVTTPGDRLSQGSHQQNNSPGASKRPRTSSNNLSEQKRARTEPDKQQSAAASVAKTKAKSKQYIYDDSSEDELSSAPEDSSADSNDDEDMDISSASESESESEEDDEPIAVMSARQRTPAVNETFRTSEAFSNRIKEWTSSRGHSAWISINEASRMTMVCANHRGPAKTPATKRHGTHCKYGVCAKKRSGKWHITEVNLVHNDACKAKVAKSRQSSISSSSQITKSAPGSPEPVRVVASSSQTRKKRVVESDEEEEDTSSTTKKQKVQDPKPAGSAKNASTESHNTTTSSVSPVKTHLLPAPPITSARCDSLTPIPSRSTSPDAEKPTQRAEVNKPLSPTSPPVFVFEPDNAPCASPDEQASFFDKATPPPQPPTLPLTVSTAGDRATAQVHRAASIPAGQQADDKNAGALTQQSKAVENALSRIIAADPTNASAAGDGTLVNLGETNAATISIQRDAAALSDPVSVPDAIVSGVSVAEIASAMNVASATAVASVMPTSEVAPIPTLQASAIPNPTPLSSRPQEDVSSAQSIVISSMPDTVLSAEPARGAEAASPALPQAPTQPTISSAAPDPVTHPSSMPAVGATASAVCIQTSAPPVPIKAISSTQHAPLTTITSGTVTTPVTPLHAPFIQTATQPPYAATLMPPAAGSNTSNTSVTTIVPVPQALEPVIPVAAPLQVMPVTSDLPTEVHEWRDFLSANGIESLADLQATFYGDGVFKDSEVKEWLEWVAEDPKTALASRSLGWRFMKSLRKYFTSNA